MVSLHELTEAESRPVSGKLLILVKRKGLKLLIGEAEARNFVGVNDLMQ